MTSRLEALNTLLLMELKALAALETLAEDPDVSHRWLAIARTNLEQGFMAARRSVFEPPSATSHMDIEDLIRKASI